MTENLIAGLIALALLLYLVHTLIRPDRY